jgi:hypothetical protein
MALEKMLAGLSSRRYGHGLEPTGQAVEARAAPAGKSAVSRRFVTATETALADLISRLYRFRTRRSGCDLQFGRMTMLGQDRGLCLFASCI